MGSNKLFVLPKAREQQCRVWCACVTFREKSIILQSIGNWDPVIDFDLQLCWWHRMEPLAQSVRHKCNNICMLVCGLVNGSTHRGNADIVTHTNVSCSRICCEKACFNCFTYCKYCKPLCSFASCRNTAKIMLLTFNWRKSSDVWSYNSSRGGRQQRSRHYDPSMMLV